MVRLLRVVLAISLGLICTAYPVFHADAYTHDFLYTDGSWNTPANWDVNDVPGFRDNQLDNNYEKDLPRIGDFCNVTLAGVVPKVSGLEIMASQAGKGSLTIANGLYFVDNSQIQNNGVITLNQKSYLNSGQNTTLNNSGVITLNPNSFLDVTTLNNQGEITLNQNLYLSATTLNNDGRLELHGGKLAGPLGESLVNNSKDKVISGTGKISSKLVNHGIVEAIGGPLEFISVDNVGGQLYAEGATDSLNFLHVTVTGGRIQLNNGSTANFTGTVLNNIELAAASFGDNPIGVFNCKATTMQGVNLAGGVVNINATSYLKGTNTNNTTLNVNFISRFIKGDDGNQPVLNNNGTVYVGSTEGTYFNLGENIEVTFTSTKEGKVVLLPKIEGATLPNSLSGTPSSKYINDTGHTIQGSGIISAPVTNMGQIIADGELIFPGLSQNTRGQNIRNESGGTLTTAGEGSTLSVQQSDLYGGAINPNGGVIDFRESSVGGGVSFGAGQVNMNTVQIYGGFKNTADIHVWGNNGLVVFKDPESTDPSVVNIVNTGTIRVESQPDQTIYFVAAAGAIVTLEGTLESFRNEKSKLILAGNQCLLTGYGSFINSEYHTIEGVGTIESPLTNYGELVANKGTLKTHKFPENAGTIILHDGTFDTNGKQLVNRGSIKSDGGVLKTGGLTNYGKMMYGFNKGPLTVHGDLSNDGEIAVYDGNAVFSGGLVVGVNEGSNATFNLNNGIMNAEKDVIVGGSGQGTFTIAQGTLNISGNLEVGNSTGSGKLAITDAAAILNVFGSHTFGPHSTVDIVPGAKVYLKGSNFYNYSTTPANLADLKNLTLIFEGGPSVTDTFEMASNFPLGGLEVGGSQVSRLQLVDLFDNDQNGILGDESLYVANLVLGAGSILDLAGLHLYYRTFTNYGGSILGGDPIQVVPVPSTLLLLVSGLAGCWGIRRFRA